jgi:hypothetical protein
MKKTLLTALLAFLTLGSIYAQSVMTDDQVIRFIVKEHEAGSSQQQIVTKLVQRGVNVDQIRRVRKKYERMQKNEGLGTVRDKSMSEDEQIDARLRRNNAKDKSELSTTEKLKDDRLRMSARASRPSSTSAISRKMSKKSRPSLTISFPTRWIFMTAWSSRTI